MLARSFRLIALVLSLAACGGGGETPTAAPPAGSASGSGTTAPPVDTGTATDPEAYDIGAPTLTTLYVSPNGDDNNDGRAETRSLRTLAAAWQRVPNDLEAAGSGYRIVMAAGTYPESNLPNYLDGRHGSRAYPIIIAAQTPGTVVLAGDLNIHDTRYLYLLDLAIVPNPAGDVLHCELCDHLLVRGCRLDGGGAAQETVKINQSQYIYLENNEISGAWDNAIDYVAVQYGHATGNRVHHAGDWCQYAKGGSAYLRIEGNTYSHCGTGAFSAGQGTGFQFMSSPWLHYEAYGLRFVNNLAHDIEGAAVGASGGYNVLFAHNTFYRIGGRSHLFEAVSGSRSCDGNPGDPGRERCQAYLNAGGWGTTVVDNGNNAARIPNRHVYVFNNIFYNPSGTASRWQHFQIFGALANDVASNIPSDARSDRDLILRGNVVWNGDSTMPLGIEGSDACQPGHPTCTADTLRAENAINVFEPQLANPASGDFRPMASGNLSGYAGAAIPDFNWADRPTSPLAPAGTSGNAVPRDWAGVARGATPRAGALQ